MQVILDYISVGQIIHSAFSVYCKEILLILVVFMFIEQTEKNLKLKIKKNDNNFVAVTSLPLEQSIKL